MQCCHLPPSKLVGSVVCLHARALPLVVVVVVVVVFVVPLPSPEANPNSMFSMINVDFQLLTSRCRLRRRCCYCRLFISGRDDA